MSNWDKVVDKAKKSGNFPLLNMKEKKHEVAKKMSRSERKSFQKKNIEDAHRRVGGSIGTLHNI